MDNIINGRSSSLTAIAYSTCKNLLIVRIDLNLFKRAKTACVRVLAMTDLYNVATQLSLASLSALMHALRVPLRVSTSIFLTFVVGISGLPVPLDLMESCKIDLTSQINKHANYIPIREFYTSLPAPSVNLNLKLSPTTNHDTAAQNATLSGDCTDVLCPHRGRGAGHSAVDFSSNNW